MAIVLHQDNERTDGSGQQQIHGVECVGNVSFLYEHSLLAQLADEDPKYAGVKNGVYLTGFKLESTLLRTEGAIDNAKLIPLLNGDTMTLTNACKAGTMSLAATRTAAGIAGGDLIAICDFIRTQGDNTGGTLTITWFLNGRTRSLRFMNVTVKRCPPLLLAGNDLPDYDVQLTYATYHDNDYPITAAANGAP